MYGQRNWLLLSPGWQCNWCSYIASRRAVQEMDERIRLVIANYTQKLAERTQHHLGCAASFAGVCCRLCSGVLPGV